MMKTKWIENKFKYDGTQLRSLFAYLDHRVLGNSVVAWVGACDVSFAHMVDGEDLLAQSPIAGGEMLHFIFEIFERNLYSGVLLQRLFAAQVKDLLQEMSSEKALASQLRREGDDLYIGNRKLSISIATLSPQSVMVHFAINIINDGTPVPTMCLQDLKINAKDFALKAMEKISQEYGSIMEATQKVKPVN